MSGRLWAYTGIILGGGVSVAANVAHTYVGRQPENLAVGIAVFWPVSLFVAVEILARTRWRPERRWVLLRFGGLVPVAVVAAIVSYRHLSGLLAHYGEDQITVAVGPLAVDGLMVMASAALLSTVPTVAAPPPASRHVAPVGTVSAPVAARPVYDHAEPIGPEPVAPGHLPNRERVEIAHRRFPAETHEFLASCLGVSDMTVRRYRPKEPVSAQANGHHREG